MALINNRDGFCFVGCVCGLGGVSSGQKTCAVLGKVL